MPNALKLAGLLYLVSAGIPSKRFLLMHCALDERALLSRVEMWVGDESTKTSGLPGEKINEMRALMGEEAFKDALGVFTREVTERHERLRVVLAEEDFAKASAELHTLFGIYAGYGFEELQHLSRALQDSCDARLAPPAKSLQQFDELLSELLQKIEHYRAEAIA